MKKHLAYFFGVFASFGTLASNNKNLFEEVEVDPNDKQQIVQKYGYDPRVKMRVVKFNPDATKSLYDAKEQIIKYCQQNDDNCIKTRHDYNIEKGSLAEKMGFSRIEIKDPEKLISSHLNFNFFPDVNYTGMLFNAVEFSNLKDIQASYLSGADKNNMSWSSENGINFNNGVLHGMSIRVGNKFYRMSLADNHLKPMGYGESLYVAFEENLRDKAPSQTDTIPIYNTGGTEHSDLQENPEGVKKKQPLTPQLFL